MDATYNDPPAGFDLVSLLPLLLIFLVFYWFVVRPRRLSSDPIELTRRWFSDLRKISAPFLFHPSTYIVSAMYVDSDLRHRVRDLLHDRPSIFPAPECGIDLSSLTHHCQAATACKRRRNFVLSAAFIAGIVLVSVHSNNPNIPVTIHIVPLLIVFVCLVSYNFCISHAVQQLFRHDEEQQRSSGHTFENDGTKLQNVIIYGAYKPFVGSGQDIGGWSFAVDLREAGADPSRVETTTRSRNFSITELYRAVRFQISKCSDEWSGMEVADQIFINGFDMTEEQATLLGNTKSLAPQSVEQLKEQSVGKTNPKVRYYLSIRFRSWNDQIVLTVFLSLQIFRGSLYVESEYFLLGPIKDDFLKIQNKYLLERRGLLFDIIINSTLSAVFYYVFALLLLLSEMVPDFLRRLRRRSAERNRRRGLPYNFGAAGSIRELAADRYFHSYHQGFDQRMRIRVVERQILNAIIDFLEERGVDTSDIKERRTTILNSGVMITGGSMAAGTVAVGMGAVAQTGGGSIRSGGS